MRLIGYSLPILFAATALPTLAAPIDFVEFESVMQKACIECHNATDASGDLDLEKAGNQQALRTNADLLENMIWSIDEREMPPKRANHPLSDAERSLMIEWLEGALFDLRNSRPNDPGRVVMPRLNHHQYANVVRDLTGLSIDTSGIYPRSGGGASGFPNDGESQTAAALETEKFLLAAKFVVSHARITPGGGIFWLPDPAPRSPDETALAQGAAELWGSILNNHYMELYESPWKPSDFFRAAWYYQHRAELGNPEATLAQTGEFVRRDVPLPVLKKWVALLTSKEPLSIYLANAREQWRRWPAPSAATPEEIDRLAESLGKRLEEYALQREFARMHRARFEVRPKLARTEMKPVMEALENEGRFPVYLDAKRLPDGADGRFQMVISPAGDGAEGDVVQFDAMRNAAGEALFAPVSGKIEMIGNQWVAQAPAVFAGRFPEGADDLSFSVTMHPEFGREGSVQIGFFTSELPSDLSELPGRVVVATADSDRGRDLREASRRAHALIEGRQWNIAKWRVPDPANVARGEPLRPVPRADLDSPIDAPRQLSPEEVIADLPADQRNILNQLPVLLGDLMQEYSASEKRDAGRRIVEAFATRAWRGFGEPADLDPLYRMMEEHLEAGDSFDKSVKLALTAVLMHPKFLYRIQDSRMTEQSYALTDQELASRLSFMLWGSIPDEELMALAEAGQLQDPGVLQQQALRMLADPKGARLTKDFAGYWLHFVGFDEFDGIDREKFEAFDDALRDAMHEELVSFVDGLLRRGAPVTDALDANYTYLNEKLADHYGIEGVDGPDFQRVSLGEASVRGGVTTMGAVLTMTSKPLRTSPVLRGTWILEELLGVHIPAPPDDVPLLSDGEKDEQGRTLLEQLAVHRDNPACAGCHSRMDPLGVALENFDPIGGWREEDRAGVAVENSSPLPDGTMLEGVTGLKQLLRERQEEFLRHFVERFTAYALGRAVLPTDQPLLDRMLSSLQQHNHQFPAMLSVLVQSEQFRMRRDEIREGNLADTNKP